MHTVLNGVCSAIAESGMPLKYWAEATQAVIYVQNFVPSSRRPRCIPAELWHGKRQDVSYLRPFGTTAYAHIPSELNLSKLYPRSVKVSLLGYFGRDGYKLLKKSTGTVFRSRDVIFEEGVTHFVKQPFSVIFSNNDDPFSYTPSHTETRSDEIVTPQKIPTPLHHEIAPRPLPITDLHKDKTTTDSGTLPHLPPSDTLRNSDTTALQEGTDLPLAIRRPRRDLKPSTRLRESHEYLN